MDIRCGRAVHQHRTRHHSGRLFDADSHPYAIPVAEGIYRITPGAKRHGLEGTLLIQDEVTVLIDTGLTYEQASELSQTVDLVVNSHAHLGHTGKNYLFSEVWAFDGEAEFVEDFEKTIDFHGYRNTPVERLWRDDISADRSGPMHEVALRFKDGDVLDFGRTQWQVILTPGHSPGHCSFYEPNLDLLYAADVTLSTFGPWYAAPGSDITQFRESIRRLIDLHPGTVVTSAKGPITTDAESWFIDFDAHFGRRDERFLEFLREPHSVAQITDRLFIYRSPGSRVNYVDLIKHNERVMVEKHLALLMAAGQVATAEGMYWAR